MISREFATEFAAHWIDAWNSHDLEQVLSHYSDDFAMTSPYIARIAGEPSGKLQGKVAVGDYWAKALGQMPDLRFELLDTLAGADSVVVYYHGVSGTAAEVFFFDTRGKVTKAFAHYSRAL